MKQTLKICAAACALLCGYGQYTTYSPIYSVLVSRAEP
jgi:hypothetical protein